MQLGFQAATHWTCEGDNCVSDINMAISDVHDVIFWIRLSVARTQVILTRWLLCALRVYHLTIKIQQPALHQHLRSTNHFVVEHCDICF